MDKQLNTKYKEINTGKHFRASSNFWCKSKIPSPQKGCGLAPWGGMTYCQSTSHNRGIAPANPSVVIFVRYFGVSGMIRIRPQFCLYDETPLKLMTLPSASAGSSSCILTPSLLQRQWTRISHPFIILQLTLIWVGEIDRNNSQPGWHWKPRSL